MFAYSRRRLRQCFTLLQEVWVDTRRVCFKGGNLGVCFISLMRLEALSLFQLSPVSNFMLTLSYVVRELTIERFVGTRDEAPLCLGLDAQLRKSPDCTLGTINAKVQGIRNVIHIPAGSYTQYVKAS